MDRRSKEIVTRFQKSWVETEDFYRTLLDGGFDHLKPVRELIHALKNKGEDKHFRIGTSMYRLIFSRSIDFGLRLDQKSVCVDTVGNKDYEIEFWDGQTSHRKYSITDLNDPRLTKLLEVLKSTLVD